MKQSEVKTYFKYDEDGFLRWRVKIARKIEIGDVAGCYNEGLRRVTVSKRTFYVARLVWIYHHGEPPPGYTVRHIGRKSDDRIENLTLMKRTKHDQRRVESKD